MPAPVVTVVIVVVVTAAAGLAFKEFVYEPHLAPRVEVWAQNFLARRQARRRHLVAAQASPQAQPSNSVREAPATEDIRTGYELNEITTRGVDEWRSEVGRSQTLRNRFGRNSVGAANLATNTLDQPNVVLPLAPFLPTHVLFDPSTPSTPTSDCLTRRALSPDPVATPPRFISRRSSRSTLRSPFVPPATIQEAAASPDTRNASLTPPTPSSHGELDVDFLSSSSVLASPFSDFEAVAVAQSPLVPRAEPSARVTSPFADPQDMDEFLSVSSSDSDESDLLDDFVEHSPVVSTLSVDGASSVQEEDLESSGVFSWASASAHSHN